MDAPKILASLSKQISIYGSFGKALLNWLIGWHKRIITKNGLLLYLKEHAKIKT